MSTIDERIVAIKFDNAAFQAKMSETLASLDKLTAKLSTVGMGKGFDEVAAAANRVDLSNIANNVDHISNRFSALGAIAFTTLQRLTNSVITFGKTFAETDILGPLITGGKTRAGNIEQAQFQFRGLGMNVEEVMKNALSAVKGTAYGLGDAAKAAAQFGASGIKAGADMSESLRAIAGTAAMTGASYSDMAYLFTTSAAMGKITNMDFQQFATRGLNAAAAYGKQVGKTEAQVHEMATQGEIDYKSFAKAMDKAFGKHATAANETYSGSLANMHAALSRVGAAWFGPEMTQQRDLFNTLGPAIDKVNDRLKPLFNTLLGIRQLSVTKLIDFIKHIDFSQMKIAMPDFQKGFLNAFDAVGRVIVVIKEAFRDIFPKPEISKIVEFAKFFRSFTESLKMGAETTKKVREIFRGFFAAFSIGWEIVKGFALVIREVLAVLLPTGKGFLNFGASVGNVMVRLQKALVQGGKIHNFFEGLARVIIIPIQFIKRLEKAIVGFFSIGVGSKVIEGSFARISSRVQNVKKDIDSIQDSWGRFRERFAGVFKVFDEIWDYIQNWFSQLGDRIAKAFKPGDFDSAVDVINVGLLGGIAVMLKKFFAGGIKFGFGGGMINKINMTLSGVTRSLQAMQTQLKASAMLKIAGAIAILTASIVVLSLVDSKALTKALTAISVGLGEMMAMMLAMDKALGSTWGGMKLGILAGALIGIATAMDILAIAIVALSKLSWGELVRGLTGVGVGLGLLVASTKMISSDTGGLVRAGISMAIIAGALIVLSKAVKEFAKISWQDLGKGFTSIAVGLKLLTGAMNNMPPTSIFTGAAFVEIVAGLLLLSKAVREFGTISWQDIAKGMTGIGAGLLIIAGAMHLMPKNLPASATGILILSVALNIMARAVQAMGANDLGTLAKGIGAFAIMLGVLTAALVAMSGLELQAGSLVVIAGSMVIFGKAIKDLGSLDLVTLAQGLGAIAAVFGILGISAAILSPLIPEMMGLGIALVTVSAGFALFGVAAMSIAKAFEIMGKSGASGAKGIVDALKTLYTAVPLIAGAFAQTIINVAKDLLHSLPLLVRLFEAVLEQILATIVKEAPRIEKAFVVVVIQLLKAIRAIFPDLVKTGFEMLMQFLKGVRDNIYQITTLGVEILVGFVQSLTENMPMIVTAATNLIVAFLTELANHAEELVTAGMNLLVSFLQGISDNIGKVVDAVGSIITSFITALGQNVNRVVTAGVNVVIAFIQGIGSNTLRLVNAAGQTIVDFLNGLADAINKYAPQIRDAGLRVILAIINGMTLGLTSHMGGIISWFAGFGGKVIGWIGSMLTTLASVGADLISGFYNGVIARVSGVADWFRGLGGRIWEWLKGIGDILFNIGSDIMQGLWDGMKKIWDKMTGWLSSIGGWIADKKGPPAKDALLLVNTGMLIFGGLRKGMEVGWKSIANWLSTLDPSDNMKIPDFSKMQLTLNQIPKSISDLDEFTPVISPVLDLTRVREAASDIDGLMKISPISITPVVTMQQARYISTTADLQKQAPVVTIPSGPSEVKFEQNNYSPEALSTSDIYRNTKSQIALAKEGLGIS